MGQLRTGSYGAYYGSPEGTSNALNQQQMEVNASYICKFLLDKGWTKNAIAGILGNMQAESTLNPGRWQSDNVNNYSAGYGLVQWTPSTNYTRWLSNKYGLAADPSEMDHNLERIIYELENNEQWIATDEYDFSFEEFSKSSQAPEYLAVAFLKNYERAGVEVIEDRKANAIKWYEYITGIIYNPSGTITFKKKNKFKFYLFKKKVNY